MKYKIIHSIIILGLLLNSLSCRKEHQDHSNNKKLILKLSIPEINIRSSTEDGEDILNENRIQTLDVFIYQNNDNNCLFYQRISPYPELSGRGIYTKTLDITQELFASNVNHSIYIVANYTGAISQTGITFSDLQTLLTPPLNPDKKQDYFIMDGVCEMILNNGVEENKEIHISLKRAASKIRLSFNYINGFSLASGSDITKKVINYSTNSSLIENGNIVTPNLQSMSNFTPQNSGAGNNNNIVVYSYANNWNTNISNETYLIVNIPVKDNQGVSHLLNYYKIPVNYRVLDNNDAQASEEIGRALYKLQRNYLYNIDVIIDKLGSVDPVTPIPITPNFTIQDWTTKQVLVSVEAANFLYVKDKIINMPLTTSFTTSFQSSKPDVQIVNIKVDGTAISNNTNGINIIWTPTAKSGNISINSTLPDNFVPKIITFSVQNGAGLTEQVIINQYPALYLSADISADVPAGTDEQNNQNMYIITSLVADFSTLPDPDEFDEAYPPDFTHFAPDPILGASYASYLRSNAVLAYPLLDVKGNPIDTDENNRRISPRFMLASQHGATTPASYLVSRTKCSDYDEKDATTGKTYSDWRMPTLAEIYLIDILQNLQKSKIKKILESPYYWCSKGNRAVKFMDPRVANTPSFNEYNTSVRCVRDVK